MLDFKNWILNEIVELKKPKSFKDNGKMISFTTYLKNNVKIVFKKLHNDEYEIFFYVNNEMNDEVEKNEILGRDPEILPSVIYLIKQKVNDLNINKIFFKAYEGQNDVKIKSNLKLDPIKIKILKELEKLNGKQYDIVYHFENLIKNLKSDSSCLNHLDEINNYFGKILNIFSVENIDSYDFYFATSSLRIAITSYKHGVSVVNNKRSSIYEKLFNRLFNQDWILNKNGNNFEITRKINGI